MLIYRKNGLLNRDYHHTDSPTKQANRLIQKNTHPAISILLLRARVTENGPESPVLERTGLLFRTKDQMIDNLSGHCADHTGIPSDDTWEDQWRGPTFFSLVRLIVSPSPSAFGYRLQHLHGRPATHHVP